VSIANHADHDVLAVVPALADGVFGGPFLARERLAEDNRIFIVCAQVTAAQ
jgi:hypothetical protein